MPLPQFQPLPVARRREPFDHTDWIFEPKHDGFRCVEYVEHGRCRLVSRNGSEFKSFSSLNAAIADELNGHSAILDSEIVSLDNEGKSRFTNCCSIGERPVFVLSISCGATVRTFATCHSYETQTEAPD